ncbi:serine recombinase [Paenibacillus sp. CCS19]|uniref:recombinase family protein n=1 Tax=Paenibacillus sp. CCS19 TaxID=3158387 RepID=UPI002565601E|nr:recombinase family protein [Paenibacillus cellulosilyticus]GMK39118.1 serine recombinase [Paenibacillus cellulosilyticus]
MVVANRNANNFTTNSDTKVKKVGTLYRVSTKKQVHFSENGGDIPTQRKACHDFIRSMPGWVLAEECEYYEKGVSGFKTRAENRDVIQQAKDDALKGKFDVLLVFMFDRLGRIDDETPFVLEWFVKQGIEMWSVKEGQQKIEGQMDKLTNYLRFWTANTESVNTTHRVKNSHDQMVKEGVYRGGTVPYGYTIVESGEISNRGRVLHKVVIEPDAAEIVKMMYDLVDQEGYGQYRISKLLNEKGLKTNRGKPWSSPSVSVVLRNPLYKGFMAINRGSSEEIYAEKPNPELVIIDEEKWNRVQAVREGRNPENRKNKNKENILMSTKSTLLLIGMSRCGCCGHVLSATWNKKDHKLKDGSIQSYRYPKYRCSGKGAQKVTACSGQTTYAQKKLEGIVLDEVYRYLDHLECGDIDEQLNKLKSEKVSDEEKVLKGIKKQLAKATQELTALDDELMKVIMGKSVLTREKISTMMSDKENEVNDLKSKVADLEQELNSRNVKRTELEVLKKRIPIWRDVFRRSSIAKQKMMLNTIVGQVDVFRNKVVIKFNLRIGSFIAAMGIDTNERLGNKKLLAQNVITSNKG